MTDSELLKEILGKREHCIEGPAEDYVPTSQEVLDEVPWLVSEVKRLQQECSRMATEKAHLTITVKRQQRKIASLEREKERLWKLVNSAERAELGKER